MRNKIGYYTGIIACIGIIATCFLPWTHYADINETFTGFHVIPFKTGNYYGKAGIPITVMATIILVLMLVPRLWAKRFNLFFSAILIAYTVRTYIVFTSALFEGEVVKYAGIYIIVVLSFVILICSLFPKEVVGKTGEWGLASGK